MLDTPTSLVKLYLEDSDDDEDNNDCLRAQPSLRIRSSCWLALSKVSGIWTMAVFEMCVTYINVKPYYHRYGLRVEKSREIDCELTAPR